MSLVAVAVALVGALLCPPAAQAVEWRSPVTLATRIKTPVIGINRTFRVDEEGNPLDGPVLPGQVVGFGSIEGLREVGPTLTPGTWVMYDPEEWRFTMRWELVHPYRSMRWFVAEARAMGLLAILAPGAKFRDRAARLDADAFHAQVQKLYPDVYRSTLCAITRKFDGPVIAQVSSNTRVGSTVEGMLRQYRAGRVCTDQFAVWWVEGYRTLAVAREFLLRVL
jgi:hypothetical protein